MKRIILFALIGVLFAACKKDGTSITIDPYIADNYSGDAKQLLFRLLQNGSVNTDKDKPEFNQGELDKILRNLQAVYNFKTPQSDSALRVHVYPYQSLSSITLKVDKNNPEGQNVLNYKPANAGFNSLMAKYGFTFNMPSYNYNSVYVSITTEGAYNIPALLPLFKSYPFIIDAGQDGTIGDGSDITYTLSSSGVDIKFAVKSGDCPAGCTFSYGWRFHVDKNYRVTYLGRF